MQKRVVITLALVFLIALVGIASAFSFSSWLKQLFGGSPTGYSIEEESASSISNEAAQAPESETAASAPCGAYSFETPTSATASSQITNYRAANAVDGNVGTHWFGDPKEGYPKWIEFDLGGKRCLNAVEVNVFLWDVPLKFEIQVSDDGHDWRTLGEVRILREGAKYEHFEVQETVTRYVRIHELAGKRPYGALSEVRLNISPLETAARPTAKLTLANVIGGPGLEKYYEIGGKRVYLEIDGTPIEEYFS